MKPFDLEAALQGEPVVLKNGKKAYIGMNLFDLGVLEDATPYPLQGVALEEDGSGFTNESWTLTGLRIEHNKTDPFNIIGMYEEPTPTVTVTLPKRFKPNDSEPFWFINVRMSGQLKAEYVSSEAVTSFRHWCITQGNCFRTEEDAQAWIDAMRDAVYE